jgi:hypothetical protein
MQTILLGVKGMNKIFDNQLIKLNSIHLFYLSLQKHQ